MAKTDQSDGSVQRKDKNRNVTIFLNIFINSNYNTQQPKNLIVTQEYFHDSLTNFFMAYSTLNMSFFFLISHPRRPISVPA